MASCTIHFFHSCKPLYLAKYDDSAKVTRICRFEHFVGHFSKMFPLFLPKDDEIQALKVFDVIFSSIDILQFRKTFW